MEKRDYEFNSAFSNVLIYVFRINDEAHKGCLKIGKATIKADKTSIQSLIPNCKELNNAAKTRINQYTSTAGVGYDLLHTELAIRPCKDDSSKNEYFTDNDVHKILLHSNIERKEFEDVKGPREWFVCNLETAKNAINAARHHEYSLTPGEVSTTRDPIVFRPEQQQAIKETIDCFKTHNKMLWNAKMRFGKTLTSLEVVKKLNLRKTIIITHRPVVKGSWGDDFEKIFYDAPDWHYIKKDTTTPDVEPEVNAYINGDKPFVLFASMQDLRGSQTVGGKFGKNELIFKTNWDCVIVDEAHEGTKTSLGDNVLTSIIKANTYGKTKVIYLSGTPFNLVEDFEEAEVFTWDYVMEQSRKADWDVVHRLDPNPYENLPVLYIYTYDLAKEIRGFIEAEDRAFNFREFFRVWTGKAKQDGKALRDERLVGRFVHEEEVKSFLNLLADKTVNSNYPYSREIYRDYFRHSLWMLPGVKEARALSELLHEHPIFRGFSIANVAGDGDEEKNIKDALEEVEKKMTKHPEKTYTITLSCGRLTTGVTVPPWTAVLMLAGSYSVSASNYLQTIFRVQSPANIDGQIKDKCFVFDFAPDRTLKMVAEAGKLSTRPGKNDESSEQQMGDLLNFCPVISIEGSLMTAYDVDSMLQQIKRIYAERVVRNGFDDPKLYNDKLLQLTELEISKFEGLKKIVGASRASDVNRNIVLSDNGLTKEDRELIEKAKKKKKTELTEEEKERLEKLKKAKEERSKAINILRAISIRIPLLIYGADLPYDTDISIENFVNLIDDQSWAEFMPNGVTKEMFNQFMEYYDKDIFIAAGKSIRALVKGADGLDPTTRVKRLAEVFKTFKNPDKETVLTPWRVVNMHMAETLGGWEFFAEDHQEPLEEPRFVDRGNVTKQCLSPDSRVLEINSKTGLYPLYITYSIFRERCKEIPENILTPEKMNELWRLTVAENVYVVCKTKMAKEITKRTLLGYGMGRINAHAFEDIVNQFSNKADQVCERITGSTFWDKKGARQDMRFDAIVGNPPYQEETAKQQSETNGQATRKSIFQHFQVAADEMTAGYTSLIYPGARWIHRSGKGMAQFGLAQINDHRLERLDFFVNADEIFKDVALADGISIVLKNKRKTTPGFEYVFHKDGKTISIHMDNPGSVLMTLDPENDIIVQKVMSFVSKNQLSFLDSRVLPRDLFGIESDFVEKNPSLVSLIDSKTEIDTSKEVKLFTNDKAGKAGRAHWYKTDKKNIPSGVEKIGEWQVVVSSANAGGQKRDNQLQIMDNHSAFGRSRVALASFKTKEEAENFFKYCQTDIVRFMFLMTDEALTSLGKKVPDFADYTNQNRFLDFSKPLDEQINKLFDFSDDEIRQIKNRLPVR